eukprot:15435246-Alexandrium_andersonii.AAC.1
MQAACLATQASLYWLAGADWPLDKAWLLGADWPLSRADLTDQPEVRAGRGRRGRLAARRSTSA